MTLTFGQVFCRGVAEESLLQALRAVLAREGYAPFEAKRIPPGYPALAREVTRIALSEAGARDTRAILFEDWDLTFSRALALSRESVGTDFVALVRPPLEPTCIKAYRNGGVVLKVGQDTDEEVLYCPAVSSSEDVRLYLAAWQPDADPSLGLVGSLADIRRDCSYQEAMAGGWPVPLREWVFLSQRSRLFLES